MNTEDTPKHRGAASADVTSVWFSAVQSSRALYGCVAVAWAVVVIANGVNLFTFQSNLFFGVAGIVIFAGAMYLIAFRN